MAGIGTCSLKRSKPNYIYSIIGVAIVLFIMGIMGWLFLNLHTISDNFKEDIRISIYLKTTDKNTIANIQKFISSKPYAKNVEYIDKEKAKAIWNKENNEDWAKILDVNPLPESIDFFAKAKYIHIDSLNKISAVINTQFKNDISEIQFPKSLVTSLNERATKMGLIFLVLSIVLCVIVIISIDNTIRLAMFSNRFLIKTMQMVGATRNFITRPFDRRALINGCISGVLATIGILLVKSFAEAQLPALKTLHNNNLFIVLLIIMIFMGMMITFLSTHRSVIKYLKTPIDDLY